MKKVILIYDDTIEVEEDIKNIIGKSSYGKIILKRKTIFNRLVEIVEEMKENIEIVNLSNLKNAYKDIEIYGEDAIVYICFLIL